MSISKDYIEHIKSLRSAHKLHTFVEQKLVETLKSFAPDLHPISEPQGVAGGRNDLILFEFTGKKVLFEVFATKSQVSRDLRILDKTRADIKIAVIIDKEVDGKVFEQFLRENPEDSYPFVFIHEVMYPQGIGRAKLWELIKRDEDAQFARMLAQLVACKTPPESLIETGADVLTADDLAKGSVTFKKILVTVVVKKLMNMGVGILSLRSFASWFSREDLLKFILMKISLGFNTYLYTDLRDNFDFLSDYELIEWLIAGHRFREPYVLLSMNATVREVIDEFFPNGSLPIPSDIQFTIGLARMEQNTDGRRLTYSIPRKTKEIRLVGPLRERGDTELSTEEEIMSLIKISIPPEPQ